MRKIIKKLKNTKNDFLKNDKKRNDLQSKAFDKELMK